MHKSSAPKDGAASLTGNTSFFYVKRVIAFALLAALLGLLLLYIKTRMSITRYAKQVSAAPVDYSLAQNWLSLDGRNGAKPADVFYLYPTCYFVNTNDFCKADNADMRGEAQKLREAHSGIFDQANFYAPYYRQLSIPYIEKTTLLGVLDKAVEAVPLRDCKRAFEYYLQNYNRGKPVIFASHSQGSLVMKEILLWIQETYPEVLDRTIAAYVIGFAVN